MVNVKIKVDAYTTKDPYARYGGMIIDKPLDRRWWETQPEAYNEIISKAWSHEWTVDLPGGSHYVCIGISTYQGYEWHMKIYINGELKAEGDVAYDSPSHYLRADFTVEAPPGKWLEQLKNWWNALPPWQKILIVSTLSISVGAVMALIERRR